MEDKNCNTCPKRSVENERAIAMLEKAGLRATAPRVILFCLLGCGGHHHHITAEELYEKSLIAGCKVSLATVYNTLRAFTSAGMLRQIYTGASRVCFDTNTSVHHHIYNENTGELTDIDASILDGISLPPLPEGVKLQSIDLVVRVSG